MCKRVEESIDHPFNHCEVASFIWRHFSIAQHGLVFPVSQVLFRNWSALAMEAFLWLWFYSVENYSFRNFMDNLEEEMRGSPSSVNSLVSLVSHRIVEWALIRK